MKNVASGLKTKRGKAKLKDADRSTITKGNALKKKRACLKCGQRFLSKGPYNRLCEKCSLSNERVASSAYSVGNRAPSGSNSVDKQLFELN